MKNLTTFKNSTFFPVFLLLLAMLSIQSGASFAKKIFPVAGALGTSALRLTFAAIILCAIWRPWKVRLSREQLKEFVLYGASLGLMNLFFYLAIARIPLGIAVGIEFTGPLLITVLASKKILDYLWVLLAALGVFLILPIMDVSSSLDSWGIFYAFLAAFFWALYIIFGSRAGKLSSPGIVASMGMLVAALFVVPVGVAVDGAAMMNWSIIPIGIGVALFSSAIPYSLEMFALAKIPTKEFGILLSLEPVFAAFSGFIYLGERLNFIQWVAITLIIIASIGVSITSNKKSIPAQTLDSV